MLQVDSNGFAVKKLVRDIDYSFTRERKLKPVEFMSMEEMQALPTGTPFVFDTECYKNFWYGAFKCLTNGKYYAFERSPDHDFDGNQLKWMLWRFLVIGFNSTNYDIPMIELACAGLSCEELKAASDYIIKSGINYGTKKVTPYDIEKAYKIRIGRYNHIDLFNVCPVNGGVSANPASLKLYAARLHAPRLQDLPFPDTHILTREDAAAVRPYCCNDLENTELLYNELLPEILLRTIMSDENDIDLRSKSDAQVAEAVINKDLEKILGYYPRAPQIKEGMTIKYRVPEFVQFQTKQLQDVLDKISKAEFKLDALGSPTWPQGLGEIEKIKGGKPQWSLKVKLGNMVYKLGMGGIHSTEKRIAHYSSNEIILADNDVESFYPRIILNQGLYPEHLGLAFLQVYESIVNRRVHAKKMAKECKDAGDKAGAKKWKTIANSLKITINGSFGKLGNKYSSLYAPQLLLQVTLTGQLVLLMLIEELSNRNIEVISANTDGFISKYHKNRHAEVRSVIAAWEKHCNFKTEETQYLGVFSRDVNNYVAIKMKQDPTTKEWLREPDGDKEGRFLDEQLGMKTKGAYCERGSALDSVLSKNPQTLVANDAVIKYLLNQTPLDETIRKCTDIRRFTTAVTVKGGGEKNGKYLGKVVRWYYPENEAGHIAYAISGNKVGDSTGGRPLMDLPDEFPSDIDYDYYIKEAVKMLYECGRFEKAKTATFF